MLLLEAFDVYEHSLCSCGHPSWLTYDEARLGEFKVSHKTVCQACKVAEEDETKRLPGVKPYVDHVPGDDSGGPGAHEKRIAAKKAAQSKKPS